MINARDLQAGRHSGRPAEKRPRVNGCIVGLSKRGIG